MWALLAFMLALLINQVGFGQGLWSPAQRVPYLFIEVVLALALGMAVYAKAALGATQARVETLEQRLQTAETAVTGNNQAVTALQQTVTGLASADSVTRLELELQNRPTSQQLADLEGTIGEIANRYAVAIHDQLLPRIIQLEGLSATKEEAVGLALDIHHLSQRVDELSRQLEELRRPPADTPPAETE